MKEYHIKKKPRIPFWFINLSMIFVVSMLLLFQIQLSIELTTLNQNKEDIMRTISELNTKKDTVQTEIKALNKSKLELELQLELYSDDINTLQKNKDDLQKEIDVVKTEIYEMTVEKEKLSKQMLDSSAKKDTIERNKKEYLLVNADGDVNDKCMQMVYNELSLLPEKLLQFFENNGTTIYVTTRNVASDIAGGKYPYKSLQGITFYETNIIYIENRETACREATLHECGHLFNKYMGYTNKTDEFQNIYLSEKTQFQEITDEYSVSDADEYFAEAFLMYFKHHDKLESHCPMTYEYMKMFIEQI